MRAISIFNDVLGPVMRGPSSSHTAGFHRIGLLARSLLGETPSKAAFAFDPAGSVARVYREQGVDLALAAGLMERPITDDRFEDAPADAESAGLCLSFAVRNLAGANHPNYTEILLEARDGRILAARAASIGGGSILFTRLDGWPVELRGDGHLLAVECDVAAAVRAREILNEAAGRGEETLREEHRPGRIFFYRIHPDPPDRGAVSLLESLPGSPRLWTAPPLFPPFRGKPLFRSAAEMTALAEKRRCSLGRLGRAHEAALLGRTEKEIEAEAIRRLAVMRSAAERGLKGEGISMRLLAPSAGKILKAAEEGRLAAGGLHLRAGALAMAVMHTCASGGVVAAAPTGGSAGVLPGVILTLAEEKGLADETAAAALLAAGAVGVIIARRATFAAEVAGCQVEIGAAGAMAAAAAVEIAGGTAAQAAAAAAVSLQNTMGSVCDLVQGIVEIPCHTRNAAAAAGALLCADLVLGGYENSIPLDDTIDASFAAGKMLPSELRCTARGGLAATPSARAMKRRD